MRHSAELVGRAAAPRARVDGISPVSRVLGTMGRLIVPVLLLLTVGAAAFIYGGRPASWLGNSDVGGKPMPLGLLIVPVLFFVVHLTNRRYGAVYAVAQVFAAWLIAFSTLPYTGKALAMLHDGAQPDARLVVAFGVGMLAGQIVSIFVFDRMRGPQWWQAPLFASAIGGIAMCAIAYPIAYSGSGLAWTSPMFDYMGVLMAASVAMVVPYWLLRSVVPPLSGFGGY